jgi:uncharacterized protein
MRWLPFVIFFGIVSGIDVSVHWYLYQRLFADPAWSAEVRTVGALLLGVLALMLPVGMASSRLLPRRLAQPLAYLVYIWMGAAFYLLVTLFSLEVARFFLSFMVDGWDQLAAARTTAMVAAAGATALGVSALRSGLGEVEVEETQIGLERLPAQLEGLTLVQLSDVHVGPTIGERFMRSIVEKTNALKPDAIVITGDLVDGPLHALRDHVQAIGKLSARYGVYFVTGNHDFYSGVGPWIEEIRRLGIRVLMNERVKLGDAASIDLAGIHDYASGASDVDRACAGRDDQRELVLLAHQPKSIHQAEPHRPGLVLSGHTHGGQLWPFDNVVKLAQPYLSGLHRHNDNTQIYVSKGTGYWGPPMRLCAPAEISKLVLVKK